MDGDADGLVDHHDRLVVVDDPDALDDLGLHLERVGQRRDGDLEHGAGDQPVALGRRCSVDVHVAVADQVGGAGAGQAEQPRHPRIESLTGQDVGDDQDPVVHRGHAGCSSGVVANASRPVEAHVAECLEQDQAGRHVDADVRDVEDRPVRDHEQVDDVPAQRARVAEDAVGEVAGDAGQQQTEGDRPEGGADLPGEPEHRDHRDDGDQAEHDGELGPGAERRARVAHQVQHEPVAEHLDVAARQPVHGPGLGADVDGVRRQGDECEDDASPASGGASARRRGVGPLCVAGGQRRSSRCLHVMHSVARGKAIARILPMGFPHDSQMP